MSKFDFSIYQNSNSYQQANKSNDFTKEFYIKDGDTLTLSRALEFDNCPAKYINGYRKGENFQISNCILADIDNTHSDNESEWITHEAVKKALPDITFYYYPSRNNMKVKNDRSARPKEHFIFPTDTITDVKEYVNLMKFLIEQFPDLHFDPNVKSPAQLNYGVENAQVSYVNGKINLSEYMKSFKKEQKNIIPEVKRNNTLHKYALKVLNQYGDNEKSHNKYINKSLQCSPLLDNSEVRDIWNGAVKYYHDEIETNADNNSVNLNQQNDTLFQFPIKNQNELNKLFISKTNNNKFSIATVKSLLSIFDIQVKFNEMNRNVEVIGLPEKYLADNAYEILATNLYDTANLLSYRKTTKSIAENFLKVIANESHYHPVLDLLNSEKWDKKDRLNELYNIMEIEDDFYKTIIHKWAIQTIAVLYNSKNTPVSAQGVLVLQGEQGIGKTQLLRHLAIKDEFFKGGATLDMTNKDSLLSATKVWICELGEIDSTTKKEQSALKGFLTEQLDHFREPYDRNETISYRRTSFCGSVNPKGYLRDETGNRRYWTVPINNIDLKSIFKHSKEWYTQFWRQIHEDYKNNPKGYLLTAEEQNQLNKNNEEFEADVYGEDEFLTVFDITADESLWNFRATSEIVNILNDKNKGLNINSVQFGRSLLPKIEKLVGKEFKRKTIKGKRLKQFPPERKDNIDKNQPSVLSEYKIQPNAVLDNENDNTYNVDF